MKFTIRKIISSETRNYRNGEGKLYIFQAEIEHANHADTFEASIKTFSERDAALVKPGADVELRLDPRADLGEASYLLTTSPLRGPRRGAGSADPAADARAKALAAAATLCAAGRLDGKKLRLCTERFASYILSGRWDASAAGKAHAE